jgi:hypothetical protein
VIAPVDDEILRQHNADFWHPENSCDRSARGPAGLQKDPCFFARGSTPHCEISQNHAWGKRLRKKTAAGRRDLRRNHEGMKRKGPTLKRSDATNGRAIVKNLDSGPVEGEDNIQRDPLES